MATFSIDEVRDTLAADISNFLGDIEDGARTLGALPELAVLPHEAGAQALRKLEDHGHAIAGTCGLVSALTLAEAGSLLQTLAVRGQAALLAMYQNAACVRRVSELCLGGAGTMRQLLDLELKHDAESAQALLVHWRQQVQALDAPGALKVDEPLLPKREASFHFDSEAPEAEAPAMALAAFWSEIRVSLLALDGHVRAAQDAPRERTHLHDAARILHALKGAAATVGLDAVAHVLDGLYREVSDLLELDTPAPREALSELSLRFISLRQLTRPEGSSSSEASAVESSHTRPTERPVPDIGPIDPSLLEIFREEVALLRPELLAALARLGREPHERPPLEQVERIFHTLKGAAATVGLVEIAAAAEVLQQQTALRLEQALTLEPVDLARLTEATQQFLGRISPPEVRAATAEFAFAEGSGAASQVSAASDSDVSSSAALALINAVEFSFADSQLDVVPKEALASPPYIALIFLSEAREVAPLFAADLNQLRLHPGDVSSAVRCERNLQMLGGSAATAGLADVAQRLADLRLKAETLLGSALPGDTLLDDLIQGVSDVFAELNVPLKLASEEAAFADSKLQVEGARTVFLQEAQQLLEQAESVLAELATAAPERRTELFTAMGRLFHRFKGSAALLGEHGLAELAGELQDLATRQRSSSELTRPLAELSALLTRVSRRSAGPAARPARAAADSAAAAAPGARGAQRSQGSNGHGPPSDASAELKRSPVELPEQPELVEAFTLECGELLERLQRTSVALEQSLDPKRNLETALRLVHTLKGVVYTIGLAPTGQDLHLIEDFLEQLIEKNAPLPATAEIVNLLLLAVEDVRRNLKEARSGYVTTSLGRVRARVQRALGAHASQSAREGRSAGAAASQQRQDARSGVSDMVFEDAPDRGYIRVSTDRLDELMNLAGELVVSRSRLVSRVDALRALQVHLGGSRRRLMDAVEAFRERYEFAGVEEARAAAVGETKVVVRGPWKRRNTRDEQLFGELELDRYDDVNILSRKLNEIANDIDEVDSQVITHLGGVGDDSEAFANIVSGIQSEVTRARTVPLDVVFSRLQLPVRDAANREHKGVRFRTGGTDVAVDKTIADALFQPMLHLVRNAVAHGIEAPERRRLLGKPEIGSIVLYGRQESGQIVLALEDDGAGLDLGALRAQGVAMGLLEPNTPLDDPAVRDLVFVTGLSTRANAGETSGRGVGCDVVRRAIERLNGDVRVETQSGVGTTFFIKLPLTLAISNTLLVRHAGQSYAIPLSFAERIIEAQEAQIVRSGDSRRVKIDDQYLLIRNLDELLEHERNAADGPIVVLQVGEQRTALQVDAVIGQEEIVVKDLGDILGGHPLFSGVTIRGAGGLTLILDAPAICETQRPETRRGNVALPAARGEIEPGQAPEARSSVLRVLVVDDSLSVRKVAKRLLGSLGVDVELAVDGVDAMEKLRQESFDIVFTDLEMPQMHGYDLIRELRFLPRYAKLPIIVVSSRSQEKHRRHAHELGATDYVTKPFTAQVLRQMLDKYAPVAREDHAQR